MIYLNAAAQLIDASLSTDSRAVPPRLRALHYPAAMDWVRIEDVLRLARESGSPVSKRALTNRWHTKDDFIRDAVIHAMLYNDDPAGDPTDQVSTLQLIAETESFSGGVSAVVDNLLEILFTHPRSFLLAHIAPLLSRHPALAADIRSRNIASQQAWSRAYHEMLMHLNLVLRRDWPIDRLTLAIQIVLDGTVVRSRIQPDDVQPSRWATASIYADTVLAIIAGALDPERDGLTLREWLDGRVRQAANQRR